MESLNDRIIVWRESAIDMSWIKELKNVVNVWQPDCIMSHGFNGHFIALLVKIFINKYQRIICSYHGLYHATTPMRYLPGYIYNRFTEFYIRKICISTVVVAGHCKTYLLTRDIPEQKINVIHNGIGDYSVPPGTREKYRELFKIQENETLIGVASRIDPVKGLTYLVSAFSEIVKKHGNVKLVIIGTGTIEHNLKLQCEELNIIDKVIFTGFRNDIPDCLSAIDIFVLPSLAEYHSIGLLEAMRAQKAIVATDVGGNTESVRNGQEGLIVASKNSSEIVTAINELIENNDKVVQLSLNARKRFLDCFTEEVMVRKTASWIVKSLN
jgi:glycosyltransferase involved in cell wall biosynthesis